MIVKRRVLVALTILSACGLGGAILFAVNGGASPWFAVAAAIALVGFETALMARRGEVELLRDAVQGLADDPEGGNTEPAELTPAGSALWLAILRLVRLWRVRVETLGQEVATAHEVLSALPDALLLVNDRREVVDANAAARELFGDRLMGRDLSAALRSPAVLDAMDDVLRGGPDRLVDIELTAPVELHLSARIAPLPRADHADPLAPAALVALHDLTALKRAEQMRVDFVANASHELRTPLSALIGFIETLQGPAADDPEAQHRFLGIMSQQAMRMSRLVEDLLSLSRIELNEHQPPTRRVALGMVLHQVAQALQLKAAQRGNKIEFDLCATIPPVLGDADELAQVFQNLLDNALKYGRPGTAVLVSVAPSARLRPGLSIAVRDQGDGIARIHLPRLTERFYRIDTARSRQMGGTGLGLAIVKHIVNRHRGLLEIESVLGQGSIFTVHLRAAPEAELPVANSGTNVVSVLPDAPPPPSALSAPARSAGAQPDTPVTPRAAEA